MLKLEDMIFHYDEENLSFELTLEFQSETIPSLDELKRKFKGFSKRVKGFFPNPCLVQTRYVEETAKSNWSEFEIELIERIDLGENCTSDMPVFGTHIEQKKEHYIISNTIRFTTYSSDDIVNLKKYIELFHKHCYNSKPELSKSYYKKLEDVERSLDIMYLKNLAANDPNFETRVTNSMFPNGIPTIKQ